MPPDIAGAMTYKSITKKHAKDKSIVRCAETLTIKSLANKRGIFIIDIIDRNISARGFIRKGELRFVCEKTDAGYDVFGAGMYMDGQAYDVAQSSSFLWRTQRRRDRA